MVTVSEAQAQQRDRALKSANSVRTQRAELKRQLHAHERELADLLADPPACIRKATIGEVLEWLPGIGKWRAQRILAAGMGSPGVGPRVPVFCLSEASKARIVARHEEIRPFRYVNHLAA